MKTLLGGDEEEINLEEVSGYFQKWFKKKKRSVRDALMKLAVNKPGWEFSGSTDNIFQMANDLFHFEAPSDRAMMIGIQGGSGIVFV